MKGLPKQKVPQSPDVDGRKITDGILQGKSGIPAATSDVQDSEEDQSELEPVKTGGPPGTDGWKFEEDQQLDYRGIPLSGNTHHQNALSNIASKFEENSEDEYDAALRMAINISLIEK